MLDRVVYTLLYLYRSSDSGILPILNAVEFWHGLDGRRIDRRGREESVAEYITRTVHTLNRRIYSYSELDDLDLIEEITRLVIHYELLNYVAPTADERIEAADN
jgi:hypothetical protein